MRRVLVFLPALVPALLALWIASLFEQGILANVLWTGTYQVDAAGLVSWGGVLGSGLVSSVLVALWWAERRAEMAYQTQRKQRDESLRRFFGRLDHELKNPLAVIRVGVVNLQQSPNMTSDQNASLKRIRQQADRLHKLVEDLRWLSELEAQRLERYPVHLASVLEESIALTRNSHPGRDIILNVQQEPSTLAEVNGDRDMLVVVFRNLLDNALKYSSNNDAVKVHASDDGQWVSVEVADSGLGIPAGDVSRIFEELFRGANAQSISGSGLGLALVWRILRLHGGRVSVWSQVGEGTKITVRFPLTPGRT